MLKLTKSYGRILSKITNTFKKSQRTNFNFKSFNLLNSTYSKFSFSEDLNKNKTTKTENSEQIEKLIFIMSDKFSIKPEKEIRIKKNKETSKDGKVLSINKNTYTKEFHNHMKTNYLSYSDLRDVLKKKVIKIFLPRDYPNSVKSDYYYFIKYSFYGGICFHIMNFLSTQALITSLGLVASKPLLLGISTGMNWVLKDGIGQLGSIFFAAKYSSPIERDLKKWRLISLYMYNFSIIFDCLTLLAPQYFIFIASFATLCKK